MTGPDGTLIIGSTGFIGSAIVERLRSDGHVVYALGRTESRPSDGKVVRLRGSVEDGSLLREALAQCSRVVYSASVSTPGSSARDPALEVVGNLLPLARLLECAAEFPARHLIYLSSGGTVYGDNARGADETTPSRPRSYYGAGKVAAEALLHACAATSDWRTTVLRPTNPYGPGQEAAKAFAAVPTLFQRALDGGTFHIWGDGSTVRDYCYIDDLVAAVVTCMQDNGEQGHRAFNVSSGEAVSITELVKICERAADREIRVEYSPARSVDVPHVSPSHEALTRATGWIPRVALHVGLARTWSWIVRNDCPPTP